MKMGKHNFGPGMAGNFFPEMELRRRELGLPIKLGWENKLKHSLYSSLKPSSSWDPSCVRDGRNKFGGIFNLEFNQDGRKLLAACEDDAILMFDPITRKEVAVVRNAHSDCVNCIKFLDNRLFASCSDDKTAAIWDVRNLSSKVSTFRGHTNWVKNVEYSPDDGLLVTSGFDGKILGWNISKFTETELDPIEILNVHGLMRTRLIPGSRKMVICTSKGHLILVSNLSLCDLFRDNEMGMNMRSSPMPSVKDRNRIELISDFPEKNVAEMVHSLHIHPQGWCALSRNMSRNNASEWTCVHDIQDVVEQTTPQLLLRNCWRRTQSSTFPPGSLHNGVPLHSSEMFSGLTGWSWRMDEHGLFSPPDPHRLPHAVKISTIGRSQPRLTNYIEEINLGPGFIKELCFSPDGRLICSPYDNGFRLLMFDAECSELSHCVPKKPRLLETMTVSDCHTGCVVSTKFSPTDCLLVTGSLLGDIVWHQPVL